ncbi:MAG: sulfite exporter TauE/SafE family protein [Candidatus Omnitrophica bacterium]|nr:sulfite exporter TauE/SafE family protein [Candidatus Omnitrophota bacterium]
MQLTGSILDYFIVFASGLLVSFTPCVYPVMPITASFIAGANTRGKRSHGFMLSLIYVTGMAIVYSVLAVVAALTGKVFGQIQNSAPFYFVIAAMMIVFAFVMFDKISIPTIAGHKGHKIKTDSVWSVLLFGMVAGLVIGPCTAPVLASLLVYVASGKNILHGVSLTFTFAYGLGFSLILVGTFSGLLSRLPKSGTWLIRIKQVCGFILLISGFLFFYKGIRLIY